MRAGGAWPVVAVLAAAGCLESEVVVCDDGRVCPAGLVCSEANQRCVSQEQLDACVGKDELAPCEVAGGGAGECRAGACLFSVCGDGRVEGAETCDGDTLREGSDCADLGYYESQPLRCDGSCRLDEKVCTGGRCGDAEVNGPELCDGEPPVIQCVHLGYDVGALPACTERCTPDVSLCHRIGIDPLSIPAEDPPQDLHGSGPEDLFAVARVANASGGVLFHHDGTTWLPVLEQVYSFWVVGPGDAYAVVQRADGIALEHFDGSRWSPVAGVTPGPDQRVRAGGADDIDLLGGTGSAGSLHWDGASWSQIEGLPAAAVIDLADDRSGGLFAIFEAPPFNQLFRFDGEAWAPVDPGIATVSAVWTSGPDDVWVGGERDLAHWNGEAWTVFLDPFAFPPEGRIRALSGTAADDVYLVVTEVLGIEGGTMEVGHLFQYDGAGWTYVAELPGVHDVWAGAADAVYLAGNGGTAFRYHGSLWRPAIRLELDAGHVPAGFVVRGEDIFAAINFVAFQENGFVYRWDGESGAWRPPVQVSSDGLNGIFSAGGVPHAAGTSGLYRMESPSSWVQEEVSAGPEPVLEAGWADGPDARFAVGSALFHDLGEGWVETEVPMFCSAGGLMHGVWGSSVSDVYAVGACGAVVHFDGKVWTRMASPTGAHLHGVWGRGPGEVYAVGDDGAALRWDGVSWSEMPAVPFAADLRDVWGTGDELFAIGRQGSVFHFDGVSWSPLVPDAFVDSMVAVSGGEHEIAMMGVFGTDVTILRLLKTVAWSAAAP